MKYWFLIICAFLISSCASYQIKSVKQADSLAIDIPKFSGFDATLVYHLYDPPDSTLSPGEKELMDMVKLVRENRYGEAVPKMRDMMERRRNDSNYNSRWYPYYTLWGYYRAAGRFDSLYRMNKEYGKKVPDNIDKIISAFDSAITNHPRRTDIFAEADTIPYAEDNDGLPVVEVQLNGKPYRMVFDTGAMTTIIGSRIAKEAGIEPLIHDYETIGSSNSNDSRARKGFIEELSFGRSKFHNQYTLIDEKEDLDFTFLWIFTLFELDGLIGWDVIRDLDITFDNKNKYLIIRKPHKREVAQQNMFEYSHVAVICSTALGARFSAYMDTGAQHPSIMEEILGLVDDKETASDFSMTWGIGGSEMGIPDVLVRFPIILDGKEIYFNNVDFIPSTNYFLMFFMRLGNDITNYGQLRIDNYNSVMEFKLHEE